MLLKGRKVSDSQSEKRSLLTSGEHSLGSSTSIALLDSNTLQPQILALAVKTPRLLEQSPGLNPYAHILLEPRAHEPKRHRLRALLNAGSESLASLLLSGWGLREEKLSVDEVKLVASGILNETSLDGGEG